MNYPYGYQDTYLLQFMYILPIKIPLNFISYMKWLVFLPWPGSSVIEIHCTRNVLGFLLLFKNIVKFELNQPLLGRNFVGVLLVLSDMATRDVCSIGGVSHARGRPVARDTKISCNQWRQV